MLLGYHYLHYYSNAYAMNQYLAARGFIVLSVNYRSGIGYGLNFREALNFGNSGGSEFNDVMGAGLYMAVATGRRSQTHRRVGRILRRLSDRAWRSPEPATYSPQAWTCTASRTGAFVEIASSPHLNGDQLREIERTALQSSPLADVKSWRSPVLLIHGDDDRNVAFNQTERLVEALRAQGVDFEELIFPGEVHEFLLEESWIKAYRAAGDFLARKLKPE